jgi:Ca2+-binding RTX toxin-like protein
MAFNQAPINTVPGPQSTDEDVALVFTAANGNAISISDADNLNIIGMTVTIDVLHGSIELLPKAGTVVTGEGTGHVTITGALNFVNERLAYLIYIPDADYNGPDTLTITANDNGATGTDPGLTGTATSEEDIDQIAIVVNPVHDLPIVTLADEAVYGTMNSDFVFGAPTGSTIAVTDNDSVTLEVTLSVTNGLLTLSQTTGLSFTAGTGMGDATMVFSGSPADITAALDGLVYRGDLNYAGTDTLTIRADDGISIAGENVAISLSSVVSGDSGSNTLTGTPEPDLFLLQQGGNDTVSGLASGDAFYFGAAFDVNDAVDGGGGSDQVGLQGNYAGASALVLTAGMLTDVEQLILLPGNDTRFGDPGTNLYDYAITTADETVAAGMVLTVDGSRLRAGEDLTFNGAAETDGTFLVYGGRGIDTLTGGAGNDGFLFGDGKFGAGDTVNGGAGNDQVGFRGHYDGANAILLGLAGQPVLNGIEGIVLISGHDLRFGPDAGDFDYFVRPFNGAFSAGQVITIDGGTLRENEKLTFDGQFETHALFQVYGGRGDDALTGGPGNDMLNGGRGVDTMRGEAGSDIFRFEDVLDSPLASPDKIADLDGQDKIDLSLIDANSLVAGDQAFSFIGTAAFSGTPGELRVIHPTAWFVQGDIDGDGLADFSIQVLLDGPSSITGTDFVL